jgi:phosphoglycerate dehydrogenase-like enzyme
MIPTRRGTVVIADFLEDAEHEAPVLGPGVRIVVARSHHEDDLAPALGEADALILFHDIEAMTDATFARAPRLKAVVRAGVGYNNVDLLAAGRRGIAVCNVPDYGTEEVADHALGMLLSLVRHLPESDASMRRGEWDYRICSNAVRLRGKTLGLVGCGRIGTAMALRAKAFGLDVAFYDPYVAPGLDKALGIRRAGSIDALLAESHFVSLHCDLRPSSRHLIDAKALAALRPGAILVNTARGPVIDQSALLPALDSGRLYAAGLDVFEHEPLDDDRLRRHPRVLLSPHSAFYSREGFIELRTKAAEEVARILDGQPPMNLVNGADLVAPRLVVS